MPKTQSVAGHRSPQEQEAHQTQQQRLLHLQQQLEKQGRYASPEQLQQMLQAEALQQDSARHQQQERERAEAARQQQREQAGQLASIVKTSPSGSFGNDPSQTPPFSPAATVAAPDTVRMQVASSLVQKGMQVGTAELAAEHIAGMRGLASPSSGALSALADPARSPSMWSGVGTLKEYNLKMQYGDLQRAAHARKHVEQCAVCQDMFATKGPRIPKIAPCLHSICKQCIESLPNRMCPMDFLKVGDSAAAAESLDTNWMVLAHIDMANLQQGRPRHCDLCDDESSESVSAQYCSHCNLHLCQLHASAHQRSKVSRTLSLYSRSILLV